MDEKKFVDALARVVAKLHGNISQAEVALAFMHDLLGLDEQQQDAAIAEIRRKAEAIYAGARAAHEETCEACQAARERGEAGDHAAEEETPSENAFERMSAEAKEIEDQLVGPLARAGLWGLDIGEA